MGNRGSTGTTVATVILLVIMSPIIYVFSVALWKVSVPIVVKQPLVLVALFAMAIPIIAGFIVGRSARNEYLKRRRDSEQQGEDVAAMRGELTSLRRELDKRR